MIQSPNRSDRLRDVRARLGQIEADSAAAPVSDRRTLEQVYLRRARQLAASWTPESRSAGLPVLVFSLGPEQFGLELSELSEVLPYHGSIAVPGVSAALLGVIDARGDIKAIVDLRRLLEMPAVDGAADGYLVMLRHRDVGFRVDALVGIRDIDPAQMASGAERVSSAGSRFAKALVADTVILLDTSAVGSALGLTSR